MSGHVSGFQRSLHPSFPQLRQCSVSGGLRSETTGKIELVGNQTWSFLGPRKFEDCLFQSCGTNKDPLKLIKCSEYHKVQSDFRWQHKPWTNNLVICYQHNAHFVFLFLWQPQTGSFMFILKPSLVKTCCCFKYFFISYHLCNVWVNESSITADALCPVFHYH